MAVHFMMKCGVCEIFMAGFDGYSHDSSKNYSNQRLMLITKNALVDAMNEGMERELNKCKSVIKLNFITETRYVNYE